jgi:hypothetical protein
MSGVLQDLPHPRAERIEVGGAQRAAIAIENSHEPHGFSLSGLREGRMTAMAAGNAPGRVKVPSKAAGGRNGTGFTTL